MVHNTGHKSESGQRHHFEKRVSLRASEIRESADTGTGAETSGSLAGPVDDREVSKLVRPAKISSENENSRGFATGTSVGEDDGVCVRKLGVLR